MAVEKSGLYYPNKMARIYIRAIEETIGQEAMKAVFDQAGIPQDHYPPPNNFAKAFDFAYFSAIGATLEKMYGARGERGLVLHAGRACFIEGLAEYGPLLGTSELAFKAIPLRAKLKIVLKAIAESYTKFSDQVTSTEEADDYFIFTIHQCPRCWGRTNPRPICYSAMGIVEEGCRWVSGGKTFQVEEVTCHAVGDEACVFHIQKEPLD